MQLKDVSVLITGGGSGLGAATARAMAAKGAKVAVLDMNKDNAEKVAAEIKGVACVADVAQEAPVKEAIAKAEAAHGVVRVLVNCAGIGDAIKTVSKNGAYPLDKFIRVINVNLIGSFNCLRLVVERMQSAPTIGEERGVCINTASVAAYDGQIGQAAYAASKGRRRRPDVACGARSCPVAYPHNDNRAGNLSDADADGVAAGGARSLGQQVPHPSRLGHPEEYAQLVESIITNPMLNGDAIRIDGAILMAPR